MYTFYICYKKNRFSKIDFENVLTLYKVCKEVLAADYRFDGKID